MNKINEGIKIYIIDLEIETELEMSQDFNSLLLPHSFFVSMEIITFVPSLQSERYLLSIYLTALSSLKTAGCHLTCFNP